MLGLGESGLAMALWLARCGAALRVADTREAPERLAALARGGAGCRIHRRRVCSGTARRRRLRRRQPGPGAGAANWRRMLPAAAERGIPLWGEIELFAQALAALREERGYAPKVIAITGTNGKTTVTSLTGLLCRARRPDGAGGRQHQPGRARTCCAKRLDAGRPAAGLGAGAVQLPAAHHVQPAGRTPRRCSTSRRTISTGMATWPPTPPTRRASSAPTPCACSTATMPLVHAHDARASAAGQLRHRRADSRPTASAWSARTRHAVAGRRGRRPKKAKAKRRSKEQRRSAGQRSSA